ncbi:hypothetical protein QM565_16940 [Geitlerinema splendidum]|nr:hypothetical protein [Geitlerinema splendidum]
MQRSSTETLVYIGDKGPGNGKHIVLLAGDEEYRSEEALPQLARILAFRHGFKCTVVFSLNDQGEIDPNRQTNQPGIEALETADLCITMLRFRQWPDKQMRSFVNYYHAGKPIIALRTSTHAFNYPDASQSAYKEFSWQSKSWPGGFGKQVLGETWVSHWGIHGKQATRGHIEPSQKSHPILVGVNQIFGTTDVYEANPPEEVDVLVRGEVVNGMSATDSAATGLKKRSDGMEQGINDPMMPIVWIKRSTVPGGRQLTALVSTMGSATDFLNEDLRRLLVNGTFWLTGLSQPKSPLNVDFVGDYKPSDFGFETFRRGMKPADFAWPPIQS